LKQLFARFSIVWALAFVILAPSCAINQQTTRILLLQAGFKTLVATDPLQRQLPPYKVTVTERNGETYYAYLDSGRNQIYLGNQSQYQRYLELKKDLFEYTPPAFD
jgi:hypothetical protein